MQSKIKILSRSLRDGVLRVVVSSETDGRKKYAVTRKRGKWACACRRWIFRRGFLRKQLERKLIPASQFKFQVANFRCKHIKRVSQ